MKAKLLLLLTLSIFISGCAYFDNVIDTTGADIGCVNQCKAYAKGCNSKSSDGSVTLVLGLLTGAVGASKCEKKYKLEDDCIKRCPNAMPHITNKTSSN